MESEIFNARVRFAPFFCFLEKVRRGRLRKWTSIKTPMHISQNGQACSCGGVWDTLTGLPQPRQGKTLNFRLGLLRPRTMKGRATVEHAARAEFSLATGRPS